MPQTPLVEGLSASGSCVRCRANEAVLLIRNEHLCKECFLAYVRNKIVKRLDSSSIRGGYHEAEKNILVPCAFDASSISLLHVIHQQRRWRLARNQRVGYTVQILVIDESSISDLESSLPEKMTLLKEEFAEHSWSVVPLENVFQYDTNLLQAFPSKALPLLSSSADNKHKLQQTITSFESTTSRVDFIEVLRRRLIGAFAAQTACNSIMLSDSTTRLAQRILSETAKGRGGALPWLTADATIVDGIPWRYPVQDLLEKELSFYVQHALPSLAHMVHDTHLSNEVVSTKSLPIDGLLGQYFSSVEENYPSIVANVVRTSNKLVADSDIQGRHTCVFCQMPTETTGHYTGIESPQQSASAQNGLSNKHNLCLGCSRTWESMS